MTERTRSVSSSSGLTRSGVRPASPTWTRSGDSASCTSTRPWKRRANERGEQRFQLAVPGSPVEPAGDEDRLARTGHAEPLQLVDRRARARSGAGRRAPPAAGSSGASTTSVAVPPRRDQRLERRAGEREAERVADGRGDVDDALRGRSRPQHDAVADVHDRDARAGRDRDPRHQAVGWTSRRRRRCVGRKPRARPEARREQVRRAPVELDRSRSRRVRPVRERAPRAPSPTPAPRASGRVAARTGQRRATAQRLACTLESSPAYDRKRRVRRRARRSGSPQSRPPGTRPSRPAAPPAAAPAGRDQDGRRRPGARRSRRRRRGAARCRPAAPGESPGGGPKAPRRAPAPTRAPAPGRSRREEQLRQRPTRRDHRRCGSGSRPRPTVRLPRRRRQRSSSGDSPGASEWSAETRPRRAAPQTAPRRARRAR